MSYSTGEALLLTQVQATSAYSTTNTSRSDWTMLKKGKSNTYAILRYGGFPSHAQSSLGGIGGSIKYDTNWITICEIWVRVGTTETLALTTLETNMQQIIAKFDARRKAADAGSVIRDVRVASGAEPQGQWKTDKRGNVIGTGPKWLKQDLRIVWTEENTVTLLE